MPDSNPRNLRSVREIARQDILFSLARVPNTNKLLVASSENKVYELDEKLDTIELRSLKQRIAVRCNLEPLRAEEIRDYIERRLALAGAGSRTTTLAAAFARSDVDS